MVDDMNGKDGVKSASDEIEVGEKHVEVLSYRFTNGSQINYQTKYTITIRRVIMILRRNKRVRHTN